MNKGMAGLAIIAALSISVLAAHLTITTWPASAAPVGCERIEFKVPHPTDVVDTSARVSVECPQGWEPSRL